MKAILYDPASGQIKCNVSLHPQDVAVNAQSSGLSWLEVAEEVNQMTSLVVDGEVVDFGYPPSKYHSLTSAGWAVADLALPKSEARRRINKARDEKEANGFQAFGKVFDSDQRSIQRISLAVHAATAMGDGFVIDWTCKDNSVVALSYAQVLQLPMIMAAAGMALHVKARDLKAQIDAAQTLEEIEAVVW